MTLLLNLNEKCLYRLIQLILSIFLVSSDSLMSQNSVVSSGGSGEGMDGMISFSIGQTAFNTFYSESGSVSEGVQHAYEVLEVSVADNIPGQSLKLNIFPNPIDTYLILHVDDELNQNLWYEFLDSGGKLLQSYQVSLAETRIEVSALPAGIYILRVHQAGNELKTFKVIKR